MSKAIELADFDSVPKERNYMAPIHSIIDSAVSSQKEIARIRNGSVRKRGTVVSLLKEIQSTISYATKLVKKNEFKAYEDVIEFRDKIKASATTCLALAKLVEAKEIKPNELNKRLEEIDKTLKADIKKGSSIIAYMMEARTDDDIESDSKAASRDRREAAAASRSNRVLKQLKSKFAHKVPKRFDDRVSFLTLPVMANFSNLAMKSSTLNAMGFSCIETGLHSTSSSDLGIVFENQLLMMFRLSDAKDSAKFIIEEDKESSQIVQDRKALQKKRNELNRKIRKLENEFDECESRKERKVINLDLDDLEEKVDAITKQLDDLDPELKIEKSRQRAKASMVNSNEHYILAYVTPILDAINKQRGTDATLFTALPLRGIMRDSDVVCVWLMEKNAVKLIQNHTNFDPKLKDWYLPWKNGK